MARKGIFKRGEMCWIRYAGLDGKMIFVNMKMETNIRLNDIESGKVLATDTKDGAVDPSSLD